jgi:heme O synthase-like polyprenyltransferase
MIYFISAVVLGGILLSGVVRTKLAEDWTKPAWWTYQYSLLYLALLFAAMVVDRQVAVSRAPEAPMHDMQHMTH